MIKVLILWYKIFELTCSVLARWRKLRYKYWILRILSFLLLQHFCILGGHEVYNTAIVLKGGLKTIEATTSSRKLVVKQAKSSLDFLYKTVIPGSTAIDTSALLWTEASKPSNIDPASVIFTFNDIVFGLEVCLDHSNKRIVQLGKTQPDLVNSIQVQLVPSCGMTIKDDSVVLRPNKSTLVFGVDGFQYYRRNTFIGKGANSQVQIFTEKSKTEFYSLPEFTWQLFPEDWRGYKNDTYSYSELFSCSKDIVNPPRLVVYPAQAIPEK